MAEATGEYVYVLRPVRLGMLRDGPTPEEAQQLSGHVAHLERLQRQGQLILAGRTREAPEKVFGLVIFRAESDAAAQAVMEADPAVRGGIMAAELHPYRVAVRGHFTADSAD